jgi:hypothetical protein
MQASAIRHLAVSRDAQIVAAGFFERTIQVWDLKSGEKTCQFETVLDFGGNRLALDSKGERCVTANWRGGSHAGVACYEARTGDLIWHRTDLKKTQHVRYAPDGSTIWCVPDVGPTKQLNSRTGKTLSLISGLTELYGSPYSRTLLKVPRKGEYVLQGNTSAKVPRLSFAILDVAFGPESICLSEAGGTVRCCGLEGGVERWRYDPGKGAHVLRLWFRESNQNFYGVEWEYEKGGCRRLIQLDGRAGACKRLCELQSWEEEYCPSLDVLIASNGTAYFMDGRVSSRLPFPQIEYQGSSGE